MLGSEMVRHPLRIFDANPIEARESRPALTVAGRSLQADEAGI
jgi:hypothetical protein